ncbi:MAG TPA: ATP-binding protein [Candidatus Saccharimonadales bacterium]|jgi:hypothetical protein|nr:ATP-binding protein [Candidatus Saccharimonadales bacterium]
MANQIRVHEKALAHLTRGLYRSPASALRELISNAWDANAKTIRISTNYPEFFQLSVQDDGVGFTADQFEEMMSGGIGNSQKRPTNLTLINGRQVIGRLGIGMLGIAQICGSFTITSKTKNGRGFKARIRLYDLIKPRLDRNDPELVSSTDNYVEVNVGEYEMLPFEPSKNDQGTFILADDLHPTFIRAFQESLNAPKYKDPPLVWQKALKIASGVHSLQELGDYWRLLWELAACCPIPYTAPDAVPNGVVRKEQDRLESYDFRVIVDGIQLSKPVYLRGNKEGYTTDLVKDQTHIVYGKPLRFHGYIAVQEGLQLRPDELRGLLIRIKDVAIGYYDGSLIDYRFNEGPRANWITGEIFVQEGLEDALNIDRDSFNRFHPEFRALQKFIHEKLQGTLFPAVYKKIDVRSERKKKEREGERESHLTSVLSESTETRVELRHARTDGAGMNVEVEETSRGLRVTLPAPSELRTKRSNKPLASAILAIFEVAMQEKSKEKQKERFRHLLLDLLAKW